MRKRKRFYDKYKRTKSSVDFENYKHIRNKVITEIRTSKDNDNNKLADKLKSNILGPKDWWKTLKHFIKPTSTSSIPPLCTQGVTYSDDMEKAEILNAHFQTQNTLDERNASLPSANFNHDNTLHTIHFTPSEVENVLKSLNTRKATGPDCIKNRILNKLSRPLSSPLCDLFNFSIECGEMPAIRKQANITPIFKQNDPSDPANYRPISLLSSIGKVLERSVHKYVFNFFGIIMLLLHSNQVLCMVTTVNQPVDIYNTFCNALDEGKEVRAIFCDISKAFDRVWHKGFLFKLRSVGISGTLLHWFANYLNNRKQLVVLPGATSRWTFTNAGVPQGSILGPLLFLVYINDIVENINSKIRLFADDTSLFIIVDNPIDAARKLNSDLETIHQWATKWLVTSGLGLEDMSLAWPAVVQLLVFIYSGIQ